MNKGRKTLGQLLAFAGLAPAAAAQITEDPAPTEQQETTDPASDQEEKPDADPVEKKDTVKDPEPKADTKPVAAQAGTITLNVGDYEKLIGLASDAVDAREAVVALTAKADQWDTYQAALKGEKPAADSKGAKATAADQIKADDPYASLRADYGSLMKDI